VGRKKKGEKGSNRCPAGGVHDMGPNIAKKVFPPSFANCPNSEEKKNVGGEKVPILYPDDVGKKVTHDQEGTGGIHSSLGEVVGEHFLQNWVLREAVERRIPPTKGIFSPLASIEEVASRKTG